MDDRLAEELRLVRVRADEEVQQLHLEYQARVDVIAARVTNVVNDLVARAGKRICPSCLGYGRHERLDAGIMRKFDLRDWDGCTDCGGSREVPGRGFVDQT